MPRGHPARHAWRAPPWLVHCGDAAVFLAEVGYRELAARPDPLEALRADHDTADPPALLRRAGHGAPEPCSFAAWSPATTSPSSTAS